MNKLSLLAASVLSLGSVAASASPTTFFGEDTNNGNMATSHPNANNARNDFFSHLIGVGTESFESYGNGTVPPIAVNFGAAGTATLTGSNSTEVFTSPTSGAFAITGTHYIGTSGTFGITFSAPVSAFGFYGTDLGDINANLTLTLTAADNTISTIVVPNTLGSVANGSALYFGFYDTATTYKSVSFAGAGNDFFGFDDFSIGSQDQVSETPVPEPAMLGLFGMGAVALGFARRRKAA